MGVYISGAEMPPPQSKDDYLAVVIYGDGTIRIIFGNVIEGATAIPVPDHGRLIDADEATRKAEIFMADNLTFNIIAASPTIIPASKEDA